LVDERFDGLVLPGVKIRAVIANKRAQDREGGCAAVGHPPSFAGAGDAADRNP
jgi:hypothetical protein